MEGNSMIFICKKNESTKIHEIKKIAKHNFEKSLDLLVDNRCAQQLPNIKYYNHVVMCWHPLSSSCIIISFCIDSNRIIREPFLMECIEKLLVTLIFFFQI